MTPPLSATGRAALQLSAEIGLAVVPLHELVNSRCSCGDVACPSPAKHPRLSNGFLGATTHPEQVAEYWDRWPGAGVAAVPASIDCVVVDVDGPIGESLARALGVLDVTTCQVLSPRGRHHWFHVTNAAAVKNHQRLQFDVKASASITVPPTIHPSGICYRWVGSVVDVAPAPEPLVQWLARGGRTVEEAEREERNHQRHQGTTGIGLDDHNARRLLAYANAIGYGLSDGRKTALFNFACFMLHDVALSTDDARAFAGRWNSFNAPPLGGKLFERIIRNAAKHGGKHRGAA